MADLDNDRVGDLEVGVVGTGSMGAGMTLLFSEHGHKVGCYDYDRDAVQNVLRQAKEDKVVDEKLVHGYTSLDKMVGAFPKASGGDQGKPRIFVLSLPHGKAVDGIEDELLPRLEKGDIVIDGGNEWWEETERRQDKAAKKGVEWIGMGVSGGYQAARHGPSMSPGCTEEAYKIVEPYLKKWAAKTPDGTPCVLRMGPDVKMIHNGIEHAHLSILCEIRSLLHDQLGLSNDEIADIFESWSKSGPLRGNFLVGIGYRGLRFKEGDGLDEPDGIVEGFEDKEIANRHVAAPAIAASHQLRVISANKFERTEVAKNLRIPKPGHPNLSEKEKKEILEAMEPAVYGAILGAFVQGLEIISKASKVQVRYEDQRHDDIDKVAEMGHAIADFLAPLLKPFHPSKPLNLLQEIPKLSAELSKTYAPLKKVYAFAVETDSVAMALGASVEWMKAVGGKNLPTDFEEMELDYFGHHNYDLKKKPVKGSAKGQYHTEFQST
ncbi:MAG: hypothetical protein TREMPRED_005142 [Tremellales sp. Tagirdzhanova-0007]|nr:MAG: hypothetical protein TREMPRED_005142 [Tremellales sp. Tagirdzhanova-0007]